MILDSYERYWEPLRDGGGGDGGGGGGGDEGGGAEGAGFEGAPEGAGPEGAPEGIGGAPSGEAPGVGPDAGPGGIGTGFDATGGVTGAAATGDAGQSGQGFGAGGFGDVTGTGAPTSSGASVTSEAGIGAGTAASGQTGAAATGGAGGFGGFGEGGFGGAGGFAGAEPEGMGPGPGTQTSTSGIDPGALTSPEGWTDWGTAAAQSPGMLDPAELAALEAQYGGQQSVIGHAPTDQALQTGMDAIGTGTSFGVIDAMMGGAPPGGGGGGLGQGGVSGDGGLTAFNPLGHGPLAPSGFGSIDIPPGPSGPEAGITLEDGTVVPPEVTNLLAGAGITEPSTISQILQEAMAQGGDVGANLRSRLEALLGGGGGIGLLGDWRQDGTPVQAGGGIDADGIINGPQDLPPQLGAFQEWMRGKTLAQIVGALDSGRVA